MHSRSFGKLFIAGPLLALPLFVVPAFCFTVNRASFVWSVVAIGITGWQLDRTRRDTIEVSVRVKNPLPKLALATVIVQLLAFAWIGAVWMLSWIGQWIMLSTVASRIVAWIQARWFAESLAWLVLFAVVCGLFRLARPILAWHRRTIIGAAHALTPW